MMVYAVHPARVAARTMALGRGLRHLRMALWDDWGVSPAAAGDQRRCPLDPAIWAARRPLARVVGEEFFVRARCGFLPYWMYGKKPHRSYGGKGPASTADTRAVGSPHKKKIE